MMTDFHGGKTASGRFQTNERIIMKKLMVSLLVGLFGFAAQTWAVAPVDMTDVSTEVVPYITAAAGAGLLIFAALYAIRVIIKAFRAAGK